MLKIIPKEEKSQRKKHIQNSDDYQVMMLYNNRKPSGKNPYFVITSNSLTSTSSTFAIENNRSTVGRIVHHLKTVLVLLPNSSASHSLVFLFSARTTACHKQGKYLSPSYAIVLSLGSCVHASIFAIAGIHPFWVDYSNSLLLSCDNTRVVCHF